MDTTATTAQTNAASPLPAPAARALDEAPVLVAYLGTDLCFRYANRTVQRWFGIDPARIAGKRIDAVIGLPNYRTLRAPLLQALGDQAAHGDYELATGEVTRHVHLELQPDLDGGGRLRGIVATFADTTRQHLLERQLRESEQRYAQAFRHAVVGMGLLTPDGQLLSANPALAQMLGYTEPELLSHPWHELVHPNDLATSASLMERLARGDEQSFRTELRCAHRDGHAVEVQLDLSRIGGKDGQLRDGQLRPLVVQLREVGKRRQFEAALLRERQLAEATLDAIGGAVLTTDTGLRVLSLNPVAEAMTGYNTAEALGMHVDDVFRLRAADNREPVNNPLREALQRHAATELSGHTMLLHRDGVETPIAASAAPIHDPTGRLSGGVLVCHDASESRALTLKRIHLIQHDSLTSLPNRSLLPSHAERAVQLASLHGWRCALLHLGIDRFGLVNQAEGVQAGDRLLRTLARAMRTALREGDTLYRTQGDEFALLMPRIDDAGEAMAMAERLRERCAGAAPRLSVSIGLGVFPDEAGDAETLQRHALAAMRDLKAAGGDGWRRYDTSMGKPIDHRPGIAAALRDALANDALSLHYQPMVDAGSGRIVGVEALLRWQDQGRDVYVPEQFIPAAEDSGLIVDLGQWVMRKVCAQARQWRRQQRGVPISVNVSSRQLRHERFCAELDALMTEYAIRPDELALELTERTMLEGGDATTKLLERIRRRGVHLSLDDFGTGYCSLSYLDRFPADTLKIDRSFVRDVATDPDTAEVARAIVSTARKAGKTVIAEGVETAQQAEALREADCGRLQGYYCGKPMPAEALGPLLAA